MDKTIDTKQKKVFSDLHQTFDDECTEMEEKRAKHNRLLHDYC